MAWKVHAEHPEHFEIHGNAGPFKIKKAGLSPAAIERWRGMCKGGSVKAKKMADGGKVAERPGPANYKENEPQPIPRFGTPGRVMGPSPVNRAGESTEALAGDTGGPPAKTYRTAQPNRMAEGGQVEGHPNPDAKENPESPSFWDNLQTGAEQSVRNDEQRIRADNAAGQANLEAAVAPPEQPKVYNPGAAGPATQGAPDDLQRPPAEMPPAAAGGTGAPSSGSPALPAMPPEADWTKAEGQLDEALRTGKRGADTQAAAQAQKAADLQTAFQQHTKDLHTLEQKRVTDTQDAAKQIDQVMTDIGNSKVDPHHFWDSKSTFGKVSAGIGMILSGMGSGLTGQPNLAAQFIQRQIEQDIDAQKANIGKKQNLLGYLFKKYGNIQDAALAAKSYLMASLAGQVGLAGARAGGLEAQANAQILKSQLATSSLAARAQIIQGRHQDAIQRYQIGFQRWAMEHFGQAAAEPGYIPSGTNPPILPEASLKGISENEKAKGEMRVNLPELGQTAHTYAPAHVAQEVNKTLPEYLTMEHSLGIIQDLGKTHLAEINSPLPNSAKRQFDVAQSSLNLSMNQLMQLQRFTHEEQKLYGPMMASPSTFLFGKAGDANVKALRGLIQAKRLAEYQRLGIRMGPRPAETPITKGE